MVLQSLSIILELGRARHGSPPESNGRCLAFIVTCYRIHFSSTTRPHRSQMQIR